MITLRPTIESSGLPPAARTDEGIEVGMAKTLLFRAYASAGSVIALAAVVGAGTKWW